MAGGWRVADSRQPFEAIGAPPCAEATSLGQAEAPAALRWSEIVQRRPARLISGSRHRWIAVMTFKAEAIPVVMERGKALALHAYENSAARWPAHMRRVTPSALSHGFEL
jgi:hypothetical protein